MGTELLYAAVPVRAGGPDRGGGALSRGIEAIEEQGRDLWRAGALALLLALVATGLLSVLLSASLGRSLREIMETARQFARGNLSARIRVRRDDELGELARIINQSADELQAPRWRRSRATAGGPRPSCPRWTTASSPWTTGAR